MAKTHWIILFATFLLSCISIALLIVSFTTTSWVNSEARSQEPSIANNKISYGLFSGLVEINVLSSPTYADLTLSCAFGENICYYSCQNTVEKRQTELSALILGQTLAECPKRSTARPTTFYSDISIAQTADNSDNVAFFKARVLLATVVFLALTLTFAVISAIFSIINVLFNPVDTILNTFGLYIWNGVAIGFAIMVLILYGALFGAYLSENIAITDTLQTIMPYNSDGLASLGASYWILIVVPFFHGINIGLVFLRQFLIDRNPRRKEWPNQAINDPIAIIF